MKNMQGYIFCFFITCALFSIIFLYQPTQDHPGAISLHGNPHWYMNFRRDAHQFLQDRDVFYHHIGKSIDYVKKADIIIIGHSMMLFGLDWHLVDEFAKKHHIKIYNMAFASEASGEFALRIVEKYHLRPSIWILNDDDFGGNFFEPFLQTAGDKGQVTEVVNYGRWEAYKNVVSKNIKWRTELFFRAILPKKIIEILYPQIPIFNYRSAENGNWDNLSWPKYLDENSTYQNTRESNCHATRQEFEWAKNYAKRLQKGSIILTVVPYGNSCRPRAQEIAKFLHASFISVGWQGMTYFDGSAHLDRQGARKFTTSFLARLEKTPEFKNLVTAKQLKYVANIQKNI